MDWSCKICGKDGVSVTHRCEEHYRCDVCGTKDNLINVVGGVYCMTHWEEKIKKQVESFDGNTDFTDNIVCPHCGYEYTDSWEMEAGNETCQHCDNDFVIETDVSVSYSTSKT